MNPQAFDLLQSLGLPVPRVFTLDEALRCPPNAKFYLRYEKGSGKNSGVRTARQLNTEEFIFRSDLQNGHLLFIESTYQSLCGGATLCKPTFAYSELVLQHPITLLRRGLCAARMISSDGKVQFLLESFQGWAAVQSETYEWMPTSTIEKPLLDNLCDSLAKLLPGKTRTILVEWMYTSEGFVFCDAKEGLHNFGNHLETLLDEERVVVHSRLGNSSRWSGDIDSTSIVDGFDVDFRPTPPDGSTLVAINGAVLSHYVTRCSERPINICLVRMTHERN